MTAHAPTHFPERREESPRDGAAREKKKEKANVTVLPRKVSTRNLKNGMDSKKRGGQSAPSFAARLAPYVELSGTAHTQAESPTFAGRPNRNGLGLSPGRFTTA